jgi:hypothetical protein
MSFDVSLMADLGNKEVYSFNLTHNVNSIVDLCLKEAGDPVDKEGGHYFSWGRLEGWMAQDALPYLLKALVVATNPAREAEFRAMEPSNKWGTLESVVRVLRGFIVACEEYPNAVIYTSG